MESHNGIRIMSEYRLNSKLGSLAATLSAPSDAEVARALERNETLPDRDVEFSSLSLNLPALPQLPLLPLSGQAGGAASLASFRNLSDALSRAGLAQDIATLLPSGEGLYRYTVLSAHLGGNAQGGAAAPLVQGVTAQAQGSAGTAVRLALIAPVQRQLGAADQFRPALEGLVPPALIESASDLPDNAVIALEFEGTVQLAASVKLGYDLTWLREVKAGQVQAEVGAKIEPSAGANLDLAVSGSFLLCISHDTGGWLRLQIKKTSKNSRFFQAGVTAAAQATQPSVEIPDPLANALQTGLAVAQATDILPLRDNIYKNALTALETKYSADLSYRLRASEDSTALIDCSFRLEGDAVPAWKRAVQGDFAALLRQPGDWVRFRQALLTHSLARESRIELHLPFFSPQEWQTRLEAVGKAQIEQDGNGRLLVFTVNAADRMARKNHYQTALTLAGALRREPDFTLAYTDSRKTFKPSLETIIQAYDFQSDARSWLESVPADREIEMSLALTVPGACAAAWLSVPQDGGPAMARVSTAIQRAMRRWLPFVYFSRPERYEDLAAAWPLIVYKTSQPCEGKSFTYDAQDIEDTLRAINSSGRTLPSELARIHDFLLPRAKKGTAEFYAPSQAASILTSVAKDPRLFGALLRADALFVDRLAALAKKGREVAKQNPEQALGGLTQFAAALVEAFHEKLKTLYGGQDFVPFGSLLFLEATAALTAQQYNQIQAVLQVKTSTGKQTFVNAAYTPEAIRPEALLSEAAPLPEPAPAAQKPAAGSVQAAPQASPQTGQSPEATEAKQLAASLQIPEAEYLRSALALYNQVSRVRLLRKSLEEQSILLDKLLKS